MRKAFLLVFLFVVVTAFPASRALGQAVYGSIMGTVTDSSGGAVPNAKITVTDIGKEVSFSTTTNDSGNYSQTHLIAGRYRVRVEAQGFQAYVQDNVNLTVDAATRVDAVLQVGAVSQTVEVKAEVPLLKTDRTDVAVTFQTKQVSEHPYFGAQLRAVSITDPWHANLLRLVPKLG